eukprot:TRINITY_DN10755_c0_g4_i1.p1 TRINITY_DN10755_c0_g4~~TRINITY_DN10755_c0_g4_i1.p1  ORF type:complete len:294 (+),score=44.04 TRINITY_DN10755_c0_g4_i1:55-882(+)
MLFVGLVCLFFACACIVYLGDTVGWFAPLAEVILDKVADMVSWVGVPLAKRFLEIPEDIYFVMDGNRRWAKKKGWHTKLGHIAGYRCLQRLLSLCNALGVKEVTVYAFSIPNFKRTKEEKDCLMGLAEEKLTEMLSREDIVSRHGVRVRVVGDKQRLPPSVVAAAEKAEKFTASHTTCTLNICFAYASRTELTHYAKTGSLWVPSPKRKPPLFVRTSGEQRFSDFMIWQSAFAHLCFQPILWPDYRSWHLFYALSGYSARYTHTQKIMDRWDNIH